MSQRKSILASEEAPASPSLRRSTRIANSPAPAAKPAAVAPVSRRRSSAADAPLTPAKLIRAKRPSLSHEVLLEDDTVAPATPTKRGKSPSVEPEAGPETGVKGTPAKRGRKSSVTKIIEEEKQAQEPKSPSRRRSVRGQSTSPTRETSSEPAPKPRGRRPSITALPAALEAIAETGGEPEVKKTPRARATRRTSIESNASVDTEEKKAAPRRSMRGRSASVDMPEPEVKTALELNPINEGEEETDVADKVENSKNEEKVISETEKKVEAEVKETPEKQDFEKVEINEEKVVETTQLPRRSPRKSASPVVSPEKENTPRKSTREMSPLIVSPTTDKDNIEKEKTSGQTKNATPSPILHRRSLRFSESHSPVPDSDVIPPRKSTSLSESDSKDVPKQRLSRSFGSNNSVANSVTKSPRKSPKVSNVSDKTYSSDSSFHLDITIPPSTDTDGETPTSKQTMEKTGQLDCSGSSTTSDKENTDKTNVVDVTEVKAPKRISLNDSSTPKINTSMKMEDIFCEPMDVEVNSEVVVATASVEIKNGLPAQEDKTEEVINEKKEELEKSTNDDLEDVLMSSFVDEIIDEEKENVSNKVEEKEEVKVKSHVKEQEDKKEEEIKEMILIVDDTIRDSSQEVIDLDETVNIEDSDSNIEILDLEQEQNKKITEKSPKKLKQATVIEDIQEIDSASDISSEKSENSKEQPTEITNKETKRISPQKVMVVEEGNSEKPSNKGSKRRKIDELVQKGLDELVKLQDIINYSDDSEEDDDYSPENVFLDDMASEGEEDTPSEDSNQIIDEGESLHSSESDGYNDEDEEDYEHDSFIADDDSIELLPGNEFDLSNEIIMSKKGKPEKKRRKSRILSPSESSDEEPAKEEKVVKEEPKKQEIVEKPEEKVEKEEENMEKPDQNKRIVILQDITFSPAAQVINQEDNLKSLETLKQTTENVREMPREPKPSFSTPNSSIVDSPTQRKPRRKSSISIQEQINVSQLNEAEISEKITKAVDFFVSSIKEKTGNVSLNVSLDYANNSSGSEEPPIRATNRLSLNKQEVDQVVDQILLETGLAERKAKTELQSQSFDVEDEPQAEPDHEPKKKLVKKRQSLTLASGRKNSAKILEDFEVEEVDQVAESPKKKQKRLSTATFSPKIEKESPKIEKKSPKIVRENSVKIQEEFEVEAVDQVSESPKKKQKRLSTATFSPKIQRESPKIVKENSAKVQEEFKVEDVEVQVAESPKKKIVTEKTKKRQLVEDDEDSHDLAADEPEAKPKHKKQKKRQAQHVDVEVKKSKTSSSVLKYFPVDMLVEVEHSPTVSKSETSTMSKPAVPLKKLKKLKPTLSMQSKSEWDVDAAQDEKPSQLNKDRVPSVKAQIETLQKKFAPNDFRNQMIYDSKVKRVDSKKMLKNKEKSTFVQKNRK